MSYRVFKKKGFTLIELLIVIAIIGILAVALLPNVLNALPRGRDAARKTAAVDIVKAIEAFNVDNGYYPAGGICFNGAALPAGVSGLSNYFTGGTTPKDPSGSAYVTGFPSCNGGYYYCQKNGSKTNYIVVAKMENASNNNHALNAAETSNCDTATAFGPLVSANPTHFVEIR